MSTELPELDGPRHSGRKSEDGKDRSVVRWLTDDEGRRWTCRRIAELVLRDGERRTSRQVVLCTAADGTAPIHLRLAGEWSSWSEALLLGALRHHASDARDEAASTQVRSASSGSA